MSNISAADNLASTVVQWSLSPSNGNPGEESLSLGPGAGDNEFEFDDDRRRLVSPGDIQPGGKYFSVVKLQIRYEKQVPDDTRWAQGTGWLIKPDLLVTAGHCAYDHTYGLGKASEVKAYVGYNGKSSIGTTGVQFRHATRALIPSGWLKSDINRQNDVAFIQLDRPFSNVTPIEFQATPNAGRVSLGVVGYPADKMHRDERAAQMYEDFRETTFDLSNSLLNMLEHKIGAYDGQNGSPILVQGRNYAIGTHVYGLGSKKSASVIRGEHGNFYTDYLKALQTPITGQLEEKKLDIATES